VCGTWVRRQHAAGWVSDSSSSEMRRDFECLGSLGNLQYRSKVLRLFRCYINDKTCIVYFSSAVKDDSSQRKVFFVLAMKAYVSRGILNLGTTDGERLTSRPDRFNPGKEPRYPINKKMGGANSRFGRFGEETTLAPTGM
jgi:hypothetical protein